MAIAVDASSPAAATGSTATTSTGAFTPPANSAIFAFAQGDANNGSNDEALTVSDNVSGTWARVVQNNGNGGAVSEIWYRLCITSPGSMTVSVTDNKGSVAKRLFVRVYTGTDLTLPYGATTSGTTAAVSYNSTVADSWGWSCGLTSNATVTAGANCNLEDEAGGFDSGDAVFTLSRTATTPTPGTSVTLTESGGTCFHHVAVEIIPPQAGDYAGPWTGPTPGLLGPTGRLTTQPQSTSGDTAVALADAGAETEALTVAATVPLADAGAEAEALTVAAAIPLADAASSAEAVSMAAAVPLADAASSTQTVTVAAAVGLADAGAAADTLAVAVTLGLAEAASALEQLGITAAVPLSQTASAADTLNVNTGAAAVPGRLTTGTAGGGFSSATAAGSTGPSTAAGSMTASTGGAA